MKEPTSYHSSGDSTLIFANHTPIALFVFKRPLHTLRTLESLALNSLFTESPLYIFCDKERTPEEKDAVEETRRLAETFKHPNKTLVIRSTNWGLAHSIIDGVSQLCQRYGRVIVIEDDLVVSNSFLSFMHAALQNYSDKSNVMQISGHSFPVDSFSERESALLLPFISSWGWATWQRAWNKFDKNASGWEKLLKNRSLRHCFDIDGHYPYTNMLFAQMRGEIDSWAIRWNWSVFKENGLVVYPPVSFVENIGFDGTGTHCTSSKQSKTKILAENFSTTFPKAEQEMTTEQVARYQLVKKSIFLSQGSIIKRYTKKLVNHAKYLLYIFLIFKNTHST